MRGQSPPQIVVQAVAPATSPAPALAPGPGTEKENSAATLVKLLQEIKAANEETLKKQAATLQQLDEMEKAAEQIKIYSKRG